MKKAIIIGASSGIGKELAQLLADDHYVVGITGRRNKLLKEISNSSPGRIYHQSCDVAKSGNLNKLKRLERKLGGLDF